ncbi:MAG: MlaD family protein [Alphaproteobacteria bacterium]|nr:MlaD family protein [Alphaproteobacteria bacterium]
METNASYTIVGAFVLACIVGLAGVVVWLADIEVDEELSFYHILFDGSVTGLRTGNPVRYRGIPVGAVTGMEINPDNVEQVRVTIEIPTSTPIKEDAVASLRFQGITGVAFVHIEGGTNEAPDLRAGEDERYPVIDSAPSQIDEILEQAPELLGRFIGLVDRANAMLSDANRANISTTLANVAELTSALAESSDDIKRLVGEGGEALAQFRETAGEAETVIAAFSDRADSIAALMEKTLTDANALVVESELLVNRAGPAVDQATETMVAVEGLVVELQPQVVPLAEGARISLEEFNQIAGDLRFAARSIGDAANEAAALIDSNQDSLSEFSNTGLFEFTQLIVETRELVQVLTRVSSDLERDPANFLFGDQTQGFEAGQ